jgi:hypothetical protein
MQLFHGANPGDRAACPNKYSHKQNYIIKSQTTINIVLYIRTKRVPQEANYREIIC